MDIQQIKTNDALGKRIYESVPINLRPGWGTSLLMAFDPLITKIPVEIKGRYEIVEQENKWEQAHAQFNKIRIFGLNNKTFKPESYLLLAEKVAKITYNLADRPAPFDKDSGWYIPSLSIFTADYFDNNSLTDQIVRILTLHFRESTNTR